MFYNMKVADRKSGSKGFTLLELLVVIGIFAFLFLLLAPLPYRKPWHAYLAQCMSNQKQVALGLIMFQTDHSGNYPWQASATNDGSLEASSGQLAAPHYRTLAPYFARQPIALVCPADAGRAPAADFSKLVETNISYFLNLNASSTNNSVLTGDRHLMADGKPVQAGGFNYSTNLTIGWTTELHGNSKPYRLGVLSFGDGHAEGIRTGDLNAHFQNQPVATNLLVVP